jgi:hypothetical protein
MKGITTKRFESADVLVWHTKIVRITVGVDKLISVQTCRTTVERW